MTIMGLHKSLSLFVLVICIVSCGGSSRLGSSTAGGDSGGSEVFAATEVLVPERNLYAVSDDAQVLVGGNVYIRNGTTTVVAAPAGAGVVFDHLTPNGELAIGTYGRPYPHGNMLLAYSPEFGVVDFYTPERRMMQFRGLDPDGTVWISYGGVGPYPPGGFKWKHPGPEIPVTGDEMPPYVAFDGEAQLPEGYDERRLFRASSNRQWAIGWARIRLEGGQTQEDWFLWSASKPPERLPEELGAAEQIDDTGKVVTGAEWVTPTELEYRVWVRGHNVVTIAQALQLAGVTVQTSNQLKVAGYSPNGRLLICTDPRFDHNLHFLLRVDPPGEP